MTEKTKRHWLLKSEPTTFSFADLLASPRKTTGWDGVRNYQARNLMKEMRVGDEAFFYHSNADPPAIVGTVRVVAAAHPDPTQFDPDDDHYDSKSDPDDPRWWMVDVQAIARLPRELALPELREEKALAGMELLRKGSRLSVQPVSAEEWRAVLALAKRGPGAAGRPGSDPGTQATTRRRVRPRG